MLLLMLVQISCCAGQNCGHHRIIQQETEQSLSHRWPALHARAVSGRLQQAGEVALLRNLPRAATLRHASAQHLASWCRSKLQAFHTASSHTAQLQGLLFSMPNTVCAQPAQPCTHPESTTGIGVATRGA